MSVFKVNRGGSRKPSASFLKAIFVAMATLTSTQVSASQIDITAKYSPDPKNPYQNKFINTTGNSGYCAGNGREGCKKNNWYSRNIPIETARGYFSANHTDPRKGAMIKVPTSWRDIRVTSGSGDSKTLRMQITGVGGRYISSMTGHVWYGGRWSIAPSPCLSADGYEVSPYTYSFFWKTPVSEQCAKRTPHTLQNFRMRNLNIAYQLDTPNPLSMESGTYKGTLNLTVGPHQDFDFGDVSQANTSVLQINFILEVSHTLKVQFPPGAERLSLNPDGGWQQWLHRGRRPEKLYANQTFQVWSSSRFKMQLQCQYSVDSQCGIQNDAGHMVPVETSVTLPAGLIDKTNKPVNHHLLSKSDPTIFYPTYYVDNARAALHFEVSRDSVKQMTEFAGSRYSGNVTVVWDAQI